MNICSNVLNAITDAIESTIYNVISDLNTQMNIYSIALNAIINVIKRSTYSVISIRNIKNTVLYFFWGVLFSLCD